MKPIFPVIALALLTASLSAAASTPADSSSVMSRIAQHSSFAENLTSTAWQNPAILQFKRNYSFSEVQVEFAHSHQSQPVNVMLGDGNTAWSFNADSYIKHKTSTLWGHATYCNQRTFNVKWNETSDIATVFPYVVADSVGGKMNGETYAFSGGYADFRGRIAWGASISYQADLNYRNVDPRPRNVTANLAASAGIAFPLFAHYMAGASINAKKYKQTNDLDFYSELGHDKVFHLTGLATDYGRFSGTGEESYFNGYQYGGSLNFEPADNRGLSIAAAASRLSFNKILTAFNKLPLCHVSHTAFEAQAAWKAASWGIMAGFNASRRIGTENVFGDAASNVYRQIGSLDMYHQNTAGLSLSAFWQHIWQHVSLAVKPAVAYSHLNTIYASPASQEQINSLNYGLAAQAAYQFNATTRLQLSAGANFNSPLSDTWNVAVTNQELAGLYSCLTSTHSILSNSYQAYNASLFLFKAISARYAIKAGAAWQHSSYSFADINQNGVTAQVAFLF